LGVEADRTSRLFGALRTTGIQGPHTAGRLRIALGYLAYQGIHSADLPIIEGTVQFGAFFIVIANLIVDVAYAFLDPRVRYT
jgi:hypothetical protein